MPEKCIVNPERDCLGLMKAKELEKDLNDLRKQNSASHERLFDRVGELERLEGIQGEQYKNILEKLDTLTRRHDELNRKLGELEAKPGKRWESIVGQVLGLVVAALVGALLVRIGM